MYVKDIKTSHNRFPWVYFIIVEDVEDKSNTPKVCNAMYVKDVEDGEKNILTHSTDFQSAKSFEKLRLRAF